MLLLLKLLAGAREDKVGKGYDFVVMGAIMEAGEGF